MVTFNPDAIRHGFPTSGFTRDLTILPAYYYSNTDLGPMDIIDKVVIGILLSITVPDNKGVHLGSLQLRNKTMGSSSKRPRVTTPHSYILTFADIYSLPNCFCVVYTHKRDFQMSFGSNYSIAETITIGDAMAFLEPQPSNVILGENIVLLKNSQNTTSVIPSSHCAIHRF